MHHDGARCEGASAEGGVVVPFLFRELAGQVFWRANKGPGLDWMVGRRKGIKKDKRVLRQVSAQRARETTKRDQRRPSKTKTAKKGGDGGKERKTWMQARQSGGTRAAWRGLLLNKRRSLERQITRKERKMKRRRVECRFRGKKECGRLQEGKKGIRRKKLEADGWTDRQVQFH